MHLLLLQKKKSVANQDPSVYTPQSRAFPTTDPQHLQLSYRHNCYNQNYHHHHCHHHQHHPRQYCGLDQRQVKAEVEEGVLAVSRLTLSKKTTRISHHFHLYPRGSDYLSNCQTHISNQIMLVIVWIHSAPVQNRTMEGWPFRSPAATSLIFHGQPVLRPWTSHSTELAP